LTERATIAIRVQPRAARDEIAGERGGAVIVRLTAPPVEGQANEALCRLIAKRLRVGRSRVSVLRGQASRDKLVAVEDISLQDLRHALGLPETARERE
jgi:uncharacterized protein